MSSQIKLSFVLFALVTVACGGSVSDPVDDVSGTESDLSKGGSANPVDCSTLPTPMCAAGTKLVDSNGDGCALECEPVACPPFIPTCEPG